MISVIFTRAREISCFTSEINKDAVHRKWSCVFSVHKSLWTESLAKPHNGAHFLLTTCINFWGNCTVLKSVQMIFLKHSIVIRTQLHLFMMICVLLKKKAPSHWLRDVTRASFSWGWWFLQKSHLRLQLLHGRWMDRSCIIKERMHYQKVMMIKRGKRIRN